MKKYLPLILMVWPYLFGLYVTLPDGLDGNIYMVLLLAYIILTVLVYVLNIRNAFTYNGIKIITSILALIFILFTIILFYSFISNTITYSKKKIGILRSLGATNKDILKIYRLESFIVSLLSYVIGMIALLIIISIINK